MKGLNVSLINVVIGGASLSLGCIEEVEIEYPQRLPTQVSRNKGASYPASIFWRHVTGIY